MITKSLIVFQLLFTPGNSATIGAAVGGMVGAMLVVVAVTAVIVVAVYCFTCAKKKGSVSVHSFLVHILCIYSYNW